MKMHPISFVMIFVLASTTKLFPQEIWLSVDSSIVCSFVSEADSSFKRKVVRSRLDSLQQYHSDHWYNWDAGSASWQSSRIVESQRMENGDPMEYHQYNWVAQSMEWHHFFRDTMIYDSLGNLIKDESYISPAPGDDWIGDMYHSYVYDSAGNRVRFSRYVWDEQESAWENAEKTEYQYDSVGERVAWQAFRWDASGKYWEEKSRFRKDYRKNSLGQMDSIMDYSWHEESELWARSSLKTYAYNGNNLLVESVTHLPIHSINEDEWHPSKKVKYSYNEAGKQTLEAHFENIATYPVVDWEGDWFKWEKIYTNDGELLLHVRYNWDSTNKQWKFSGSAENLYNSLGFNSIQITFKPDQLRGDSVLTEKTFYYPAGQFVSVYDTVCTGKTYSWEGRELSAEGVFQEQYISRWGADSLRTLYLSEKDCEGVGLAENPGHQAMVLYPVPVKDFLYISSVVGPMEISVVNMKGRELVHVTGTSVDMSELQSGFYLVSLRNRKGDLVSVQKILKE